MYESKFLSNLFTLAEGTMPVLGACVEAIVFLCQLRCEGVAMSGGRCNGPAQGNARCQRPSLTLPTFLHLPQTSKESFKTACR